MVVSDATTFRLMFRELPRRKVAVVLLLVLVNLGTVTWWFGHVAAAKRRRDSFLAMKMRAAYGHFQSEEEVRAEREEWVRFRASLESLSGFVPPWEWTSREWRETFLWK